MSSSARNYVRSICFTLLLIFGGVSSFAHAATFSDSLAIGSYGTQVIALQSYLTTAGYFNGPQTGYYGTLTKIAVAEFQRDHGIAALGIVGPQTREVLTTVSSDETGTITSTSGAAPALTAQLTIGSSGDQVVALQQFLKDAGFYTYPQITGFFGPRTASAVSAFQIAHGIAAVGEVGPQTRAQINASLTPTSVEASSGSPSSVAPSPQLPLATNSGAPHSGSSAAYTPTPNVNSGTSGDTTPPVVSVTSPSTGSIVSGTTVSFVAAASDNVAVTGVQFVVDGAPVGSLLTNAPYTYSWQSTGVADGSHSIQAVARDAAGNYATSSARSVTVDNTAPVRSLGAPSSALPLGTSSTTLSLTTNESATCKYSTSTGVSFASMTNTFTSTGGTAQSTNVTGLVNGGSYAYYVRCQDSIGNANASDYAISFTVAQDATAPTVSITAPSNNTSVSRSLTITATATDDVSVAGVQFLLDGSPLGSEQVSGPYTYSLNTTGISDGAHSLTAVARDGANNYATSTVVSITVDNTAPTFSAISAGTPLATTTTISWTTNENATTQVQYGLTTSYGMLTTRTASLVTPHSTLLSGLTPSTTYHYEVISSDAQGNTATSSDNTFVTAAPPDVTPPIISSVSSTTATSTASVSWTTNEPANSQVEYGTTSSYGTLTTLDSTLLTSHSVSIASLAASTTYHFRIRTSDAAGNLATSTDATFTTTALPDTTPPVLSAIASSTSATSATITWTTDENANSRIDVGTTTSYSLASTSATFSTTHSLTLNGLATSTLYHFRVQSADPSGNTATSTDLTFTTATPVPTQLLMTNRTNLMGYNGYSGSSGDTDSNSRISMYNQTGTGVSKFRLYYAGWFATPTNEQDGYNPVTISASVEYPAGTFTQVLFGGAATTSLLASETRQTDEVNVSIPAAAQFWVRTYVSVSTTSQRWVQGYVINTATGESADFSTGADKTMGGTITNATVTGVRHGFGPIGLKATAFTGTPVKRAFAFVGDSILMQAGDGNFDAKGDGGWNGRALTDVFPQVNFAISGTSAFGNLPANFTRRLNALNMLGVTDILDDFSNNDLAAGRTYTQLTGDITTIVTSLQSNGFRVHYATPLPYTTSTDSWKTIANQSIYTSGGDYTGTTSSVRSQIANFIRSNTIGLAGVVDIADGVDVNTSNVLTRNGGYWISGNSPSASPSVHLTSTGGFSDSATLDGRHPDVTNVTSPFYGGHYILKDIFAAYLALLPNL